MAIPATTTITAAMGNTIRAKLPLLTAVGLLSLVVLMLSWPRFLASFRFLPVDIAIQRYFEDQQIPTDRLPALVDFAEQAIDLHDYYRFHEGLSRLHYLRALDPYTPALERRPAYRQSEAEAVVALSQAPAQSATWLRVAVIRWILHDEPEDVIRPWTMSIYTGRTNFPLFEQRVELGLAYHDLLDEEQRSLLRDQLLLSWRARPGGLIEVLYRRDRNLAITSELIAGTDPGALAEMEALLARHH